MTRIVVNAPQLDETASLLESAAGDYQAIAGRVAGCDCGCMPADVAAVVDSTAASMRSRLEEVSGEMSAAASDLAQRAGVGQDGGFNLVIDSGSGSNGNGSGGANLVILGDTTSTAFAGGLNLTVFSDGGTAGYAGGGGQLVIGRSDEPSPDGISLITSRPLESGDSYLQRVAAGDLPDPFGDILANLGRGIRSPAVPIGGGLDIAYGMNQLDLAGMLTGGTGPNNMTGSVTHDRGIVWHPLGTFPPLY
jgi:hypothetical protein